MRIQTRASGTKRSWFNENVKLSVESCDLVKLHAITIYISHYSQKKCDMPSCFALLIFSHITWICRMYSLPCLDITAFSVFLSNTLWPCCPIVSIQAIPNRHKKTHKIQSDSTPHIYQDISLAPALSPPFHARQPAPGSESHQLMFQIERNTMCIIAVISRGYDSYDKYTHSGRNIKYCKARPSFLSSGHRLIEWAKKADGGVRNCSDNVDPYGPLSISWIWTE